ncbi:MAG: cation:proton antiporter [Lachnospirales bacterium]
MLTSLGLIFISGLLLGEIAYKLHLPKLVGMIAAGIIIGPYCLNLLSGDILNISSELRRFALVIILTRAGLSLNIEDLKKVGRPAIMMCFVPAAFELIATTLIAPKLFNISYLDAALLGSVLGAVSPAVVVPRMLKLMEEGYGTKKSIPQLILTGASADDVFVIIIFTSLMTISQGGSVSAFTFVEIPLSIILGIILGIITGIVINILFKNFNIKLTVKTIILLAVSFFLLEIETKLENYISISSLISIMVMGITLFKLNSHISKEISAQYNSLWVGGEIILFVLVGCQVDLSYAINSGIFAVLLVAFALIFRMIGVFVCLIGANINKKEKLFCMLAYTPKATVQAAIGALPLAAGLGCGKLILTVAVLAIIITAPLGAAFIDNSYKKLLLK